MSITHVIYSFNLICVPTSVSFPQRAEWLRQIDFKARPRRRHSSPTHFIVSVLLYMCCAISEPFLAFKRNPQAHRNASGGLKRKRSQAAFGNESEDEGPRCSNGIHTNGAPSNNPNGHSRPSLLAERKQLPIWSGRKALMKAVQENDTLIVLGETGSGKTTREFNLYVGLTFGALTWSIWPLDNQQRSLNSFSNPIL